MSGSNGQRPRNIVTLAPEITAAHGCACSCQRMHGLSHGDLGPLPAWHLLNHRWRDEAGDAAIVNHHPPVRDYRAVVCSASISASSKMASPSSTNGRTMFSGGTIRTTGP